VFAKQECPSPHSALDPLGHGLDFAQFSTRALQLDPQKYLDAISSTAMLFVFVLGLSPISGVQTDGRAGDVPLPLLADDGMLPLQGVPLKHDIPLLFWTVYDYMLSQLATRVSFYTKQWQFAILVLPFGSPDGHGIAFSQSI
jgi:hypothetical protein